MIRVISRPFPSDPSDPPTNLCPTKACERRYCKLSFIDMFRNVRINFMTSFGPSKSNLLRSMIVKLTVLLLLMSRPRQHASVYRARLLPLITDQRVRIGLLSVCVLHILNEYIYITFEGSLARPFFVSCRAVQTRKWISFAFN